MYFSFWTSFRFHFGFDFGSLLDSFGTLGVPWGFQVDLRGVLEDVLGALWGALGILGATGPAPKGAKPPWGRADWATPVILRWFLGSRWVTLCGDLRGQPNMQTDSQPDSSTPRTDRQTDRHRHRQTDRQTGKTSVQCAFRFTARPGLQARGH